MQTRIIAQRTMIISAIRHPRTIHSIVVVDISRVEPELLGTAVRSTFVDAGDSVVIGVDVVCEVMSVD